MVKQSPPRSMRTHRREGGDGKLTGPADYDDLPQSLLGIHKLPAGLLLWIEPCVKRLRQITTSFVKRQRRPIRAVMTLVRDRDDRGDHLRLVGVVHLDNVTIVEIGHLEYIRPRRQVYSG